MTKWFLSGAYLLCNACCGVFYLISGGSVFSERAVALGGLAMLIACAAMAVSLLRGRHPVQGTAKCMTAFLLLMHLGIILCWAYWFPSQWVGYVVHCGLFLFSVGYLYWLIQASGTAAFWSDYEFRPWQSGHN